MIYLHTTDTSISFRFEQGISSNDLQRLLLAVKTLCKHIKPKAYKKIVESLMAEEYMPSDDENTYKYQIMLSRPTSSCLKPL